MTAQSGTPAARTSMPSSAPGAASSASSNSVGYDGGPGSIGEALGAVSRDLSDLVRQEIELAKAEARQSVTRAGRSAGMIAGAAIGAVFTLLFLSYALWEALDEAMPAGWAALIVAAVWAVIAAVLASVARQQLRAVPGLEQTKETVRDIPRALKGEETR